MKIFFTDMAELRKLSAEQKHLNILKSFYYAEKDLRELRVSYTCPITLMIDSGAFTAYQQKIEINLNDYAQFLIKNQKHIDFAFNLDIMNDNVQSYKNWKRLTDDFGLDWVIPVFQSTGGFRWLEEYCNQRDYVAIGGIIELYEPFRYLEKCVSIAKKHNTKLHLFGILQPSLIESFKPYSIDSSNLRFCTKGQLYYFDEKLGLKKYPYSDYRLCNKIGWKQYQRLLPKENVIERMQFSLSEIKKFEVRLNNKVL